MHSKKKGTAVNFDRFPFYSNRRGMQPSFVSLFFNKDSWICMIGYVFLVFLVFLLLVYAILGS